MHRLVPIVFSGLLAGAAAAQTPGFWTVGWPAGGTNSYVLALSRDGTVAAGHSVLPGGQPGFRWTRKPGRQDWGLLPGMPPYTQTYGASENGQVLVGRQTDASLAVERAFRLVGNGPLQDLGLLPGEQRSVARAVSGDGSIVVGTAEHGPWTNSYGQAFRWSASGGGLQGLGYLRPNGTFSKANAISSDGSTIVGMSQSDGPGGPMEAYRWTQSGGTMEALPYLPGAAAPEAEAFAVNANGTIAVGGSESATNFTHAVRWTQSGVEDLALSLPNTHSRAYALSDDGTVVGGSYQSGPGMAFVWTAGTGMIDLDDFLGMHGVAVPANYRLEYVHAISGDGLSFGGIARDLTTNRNEGFVATIPAPPSVILVLAPCFSIRRRCG